MLGKILDSDLVDKGVIGLPDIPGLPVEEMQRKFEETAREVIIPKFNALVDALSAEDAAGNVGAVSVNPQELTESQKAAARENIGAASATVETKVRDIGEDIGALQGEIDEFEMATTEALSGVNQTAEKALENANASVTYTEQSLSDTQKAQARANIGAIGALEIGEMGGTVSYAAKQDLTEEQKKQAQENIGAASTDFVINCMQFICDYGLGGCWIDFTDEDGNPTDEPYIHWEQEV